MALSFTLALILSLSTSSLSLSLPLKPTLSKGAQALADSKSHHETFGSPAFWTKLIISAVFIILGGIFAGLTLGLMGLDELHLRVLATSSDNPVEKRNAAKVLRLLKGRRHWVLVVLLLGNVIVNESLPIFLDSAIGGGVAAVAISTAMIVIFGEILPQSICSRYGLQIGAKCVPFVTVLMWLFSPIAYPTAKLLDYALGSSHGTTYKKQELRSFLAFHRTNKEDPLRDDEISILNGVLELNTKSVEGIMTPMHDVVCLGADKIMDHKAVDAVLTSGYSRFPVHEPGHPTSFIGLLLIKKLIDYDPDDKKPVSAFPLSILPQALPSINCFQALDYFQTGRAHLLLVSNQPGTAYGALGVITLEDIIEEIIAEEIVDETDRFIDNRSKKRANRQSTASIMRGIVEISRSGEKVTLMSKDKKAQPQVDGSVLTTYGAAMLGGGPNGLRRRSSSLSIVRENGNGNAMARSSSERGNGNGAGS